MRRDSLIRIYSFLCSLLQLLLSIGASRQSAFLKFSWLLIWILPSPLPTALLHHSLRWCESSRDSLTSNSVILGMSNGVYLTGR